MRAGTARLGYKDLVHFLVDVRSVDITISIAILDGLFHHDQLAMMLTTADTSFQ